MVIGRSRFLFDTKAGRDPLCTMSRLYHDRRGTRAAAARCLSALAPDVIYKIDTLISILLAVQVPDLSSVSKHCHFHRYPRHGTKST